MSIFENITAALVNMEEGHTLALVRAAVMAGKSPQDVLDGLTKGMEIVGEKFSSGEYFVAQMMMAADIFRQAAGILVSALTRSVTATRGKVVVATVHGDIHDLGKNLVAAMLRGAGFKVIDLGVDVSPERIVAALQDSQARVLCLSGLNLGVLDGMKATIQALDLSGLRPPVKVIIGSGRIDAQAKEYTGADAWGKTPQDAVAFCRVHAKDSA